MNQGMINHTDMKCMNQGSRLLRSNPVVSFFLWIIVMCIDWGSTSRYAKMMITVKIFMPVSL